MGNALALPFEDASFDLVTSRTFFTSISAPEKAMAEMKRVLKPGGTIASITAMAFMPSAADAGVYPETCTWYQPLQSMTEKLYRAYERLAPIQPYIPVVNPTLMPRFFAHQGLRRICAYPIGKISCWSNAAVPTERCGPCVDCTQSDMLYRDTRPPEALAVLLRAKLEQAR